MNALRFSTNQLNSLVSDVLDFNKIKSNEIILQPKWTDLNVFCNELVNSTKYQAKLKGVQLQLLFDEGLIGKKHLFDPARLYQILNNLISNAIKFTEEKGMITFTVRPKDPDHICFSIRDTGQGISTEDINRIQDRNFTSNYTTGAGLGLAIVKDLLRLHKVELNISSQMNVGSEFSFTLVLESKKNDRNSLKLQVENLNAALHILIIEDDPVIRDWYAHIFKNCEVTFLKSPADIETVKSKQFNFIISDLNFETGLLDFEVQKTEFLNLLIKNGKLIIISGNEIHVEDDWVSVLKKPVDKSQILAIIGPTKQFQEPNFENIEKDYDYNHAFTSNAIGIMIQSWEQDQLTLEDALNNLDAEQFGKVQHRIITSLRRLDLSEFELLLNRLIRQIESNQTQTNAVDELNEFFNFYLTALRHYQDRNS